MEQRYVKICHWSMTIFEVFAQLNTTVTVTVKNVKQ